MTKNEIINIIYLITRDYDTVPSYSNQRNVADKILEAREIILELLNTYYD